MGNKRADSALADALHGLVFQALIDDINRYRNPGVDENGRPLPIQPIPPALFAQALKALKDNGIDSPVRAKALKDALDAALPDLGDVEDEHLST